MLFLKAAITYSCLIELMLFYIQDTKTIHLRVNMLWIMYSFLFITSSFRDDSAPGPSGGIEQATQAYGTVGRALISGPDESDDYPGTTSISTDAVTDRFHQFHLRFYIPENHMISIQKNTASRILQKGRFSGMLIWGLIDSINIAIDFNQRISFYVIWSVYVKFLFRNRMIDIHCKHISYDIHP